MEAAQGHATVSVDLEQEQVVAPEGQIYKFKVPPNLRDMLLNGADEIDQTLRGLSAIKAYWAKDAAKRPWVHSPGLSNDTDTKEMLP